MRCTRTPWWWLLPALILASCEPFPSRFDYAPDDGKLQLIGRMDLSTEDGPTYALPGVTVRFLCNCTGVDIAFADKGEGGELHTNFISIFVDGTEVRKVQLQPTPHLIEGVHDLPRGEHLIELVKSTDAYAGPVQFLGINLLGVLLPPPPRPEKRVEFIGDSMTCGYGNEVRIDAPTYTEPNTGYHSKNQDAARAYGLLTGRKLGADVTNLCAWGLGVYRNSDGRTDEAMPTLYARVFPEQKTPTWDLSRSVPDAIVVNLGTSDFSAGPPPKEDFKKAYATFIRRLHEVYPRAKIVCAVGPMLNDNYPVGGRYWTLLREYVSEMVEELHASGERNVHYFAFTPLSDPYGEDWHPTAEYHERMAEELATFLRGIGF